MVSKPNYLLEYAIDSLLKTFNPDRKPVMPKYTFFKLMNLLDTRLRKQGIDIELPGYWYKFGFYIEPSFLDIVLPQPFTKFYMIDSTHVVPPIHPNRKYQIVDHVKTKIDSTVYWLWKQFGFKPGYGAKVKKESYEINSPYKFNTIFQEYIKIAERDETCLIPKRESLEPLLDSLLSEFPEKEFPELYNIYLEWDDTTRLILDYVPGKKKDELIRELMELFWETYSTGVKIRHNQHIPIPDILQRWKKEYELSTPDTYKQIENIRTKVLLDHYKASGRDDELVRQLMKKAYEMSAEAH
jgi:hypothetical protein